MEIENIKSEVSKSNPFFFEALLLQNVNRILDKKLKQSVDVKMQDIIQKLKKVKYYQMVIKEDTISYNDSDQKEIMCNLCQHKYKSYLELTLHWLYTHREINFKITFHNMINECFILHVECKKKVFSANEKDIGEIENFYIQIKKKEKLFDKIKRRFKKIFSEANVYPGKKKNKVRSRKILGDTDSDNIDEEKKPMEGYTSNNIREMLKGRVFFHTKHMFRKISEDSLLKESEDEIDDRDIRKAEEEAIDAFEDVDDLDKKFFKMWNNYIREEKLKYEKEKLVAFTLKGYGKFLNSFIKLNKEKIKANQLRNSLVMHLTTLHIYGMITKDDIVNVLLEYEKNI